MRPLRRTEHGSLARTANLGRRENEMKKYMEPSVEIELFAVEDVITASTGISGGADVGGAGEPDFE